MSRILASIDDRNFTMPVAPVDVELVCQRFSWASVGGPHRATLVGQGDLRSLAAAFDRLRCPVMLRTAWGAPCWWGFVSRVTLQYDGVTIGASLDEMTNMVTLLYTESVGGETVASAAGPEIDEVSIATYGIKEFRENMSQGDAASAALRLALLLKTQGRPVPLRSFGDLAERPTLTYECAGWWDTLWWRYYSRADHLTVATDAQITAIVAAAGQFLIGTLIPQTSGVSIPADQDGLSKAGDILSDLLRIGTTTAARYLAKVTQERALKVWPEPDIPDPAQMLIVHERTRVIHDSLDQPMLPHIPPVGLWSRLAKTLPTLRFGAMSDPRYAIIEHAEYVPEAGFWQIETRGANDLRWMMELAG